MIRPHFSTTLRRGVLAACIASACGGAALAQSAPNVTRFEYDAGGNLTKVTDGLDHASVFAYDALSRRVGVTDAKTGVTRFTYDGLDQLTRVEDARKVATVYQVDGLGDLTQTTSPDTGVTLTAYDEAGNLIRRTDAKQQTTKYDYDALNRLRLITHHDASTVTYTYDQGPNAIGRLSKIADSGGSIEYGYDGFGRVISELRTIGGTAYTTGYRYDGATGRLAGLTYPSGRRVDYQYDALGRVAGITTSANGVSGTLVSDVRYEPFGPVKALTFGNGQTQLRPHDLDGRLSSYTLGGKKMTIGYDPANRITSIADAANLPGGNTYGYDELDRLTSLIAPAMTQGYAYDAVGNRIQKSTNGAPTTLTYALTSNRLLQVGTQAIATDPNGSITGKANATLNYDVRGRLVSANTQLGLVQYTINSLGQRVRKVTPTETTVFHYDATGKLIAESVTAGTVTRTQEYVYLGNLPVAVLK